MAKKNTLFVSVFILAAFATAGGSSYAQSRNVEINLDVLNDFKPEKPAPSPGPKQAPLTGLSKEVPLYKPLPPLPLTKPVEPAPPVVTEAPQVPIEPPSAPPKKVIEPLAPPRVQEVLPAEPVKSVEVKAPTPPEIARLSPPVPQQRPTVLNAPQSFVERARADYQAEQPKPAPEAASKIKGDGPAVVPVDPNDPLARKLVNPSVQDILASIDPDTAESGQLTPRKLTLAYQPGITDLPPEIRDTLTTQLLNSLMTMPTARIEILGYASSDEGKTETRRISLTRALEVREFLVRSGINPSTINLRSMEQGNSDAPADRVDIVISP